MQKIINDLIGKAANKQPTDYIDKETGLIYCGICHKPKQQILSKKYSCFERYNNIVPRDCDCQKAKRKVEDEQKAEERRVIEAEKRRQECFKGKERNFTFSKDDSPNSEPSKRLKKWAADFDISCGDWVLLYGGCGGGKSFYAAAICNEVINKGYSAWYTNLSSLEDLLQRWGERQAVYDELSRVNLLVLDDFGSERGTDYKNEIVFNVIDCRYRTGKATILTSNLSLNEILKPDSLNMQRIMSRISENMLPIAITHSDRRIQALKRRIKEM